MLPAMLQITESTGIKDVRDPTMLITRFTIVRINAVLQPAMSLPTLYNPTRLMTANTIAAIPAIRLMIGMIASTAQMIAPTSAINIFFKPAPAFGYWFITIFLLRIQIYISPFIIEVIVPSG